jgi:hypothetical protein
MPFEPVKLIRDFFASTAGESFANEANLQHRLALYLAKCLPAGFQLILECPTKDILPNAPRLVKKEIDLVIRSANGDEIFVVELKCPRQGQYPEQMFKICQDLQFLEELVEHGCDGGVFAAHVIDPLYYSSGSKAGIYAHFRGDLPLTSKVLKPTGARNEEAILTGTYSVAWAECGGSSRYWIQSVAVVPIGEDPTPPSGRRGIDPAWSRMGAKVVNSRRFSEMPLESSERLRRALTTARPRAGLAPGLARLVDECLESGDARFIGRPE